MKIVKLVFLLIGITSPAFGMSVIQNGCYYDCHNEVTMREIKTVSYQQVTHKEYWDERAKGVGSFHELMASVPQSEKHQCMDYKEWDKVVGDVNSGNNKNYIVNDKKLFTVEGKRYLRCGDPENTFAKYIEKYSGGWITKSREWVEMIPIIISSLYPLDNWVCTPIYYNYPGYYGGHGGHGGHDDPTPSPAPVPEPTTLVLMGIGLCFMTAIKRKK